MNAKVHSFDEAPLHRQGRDGGLPLTGIPLVIVNGTIVVKESKVLKDVYPVKPIRLPIMTSPTATNMELF